MRSMSPVRATSLVRSRRAALSTPVSESYRISIDQPA
jgi:hypothetical protein